jgi:hypothetical protein
LLIIDKIPMYNSSCKVLENVDFEYIQPLKGDEDKEIHSVYIISVVL